MKKTVDKTGEENINTQGLKMWIKEYRKYNDIDIEFEDGFISYNKNYGCFKKGSVENPNFKPSIIKNRVGEINYNHYESKMEIIKYHSATNIVIKFDNGYETTTSYSNFKKGDIKSPYDKSVFSIGYLGEGKYKHWENGNKTKSYICWFSMFNRCYNEKQRKSNLTYINVSVCDEWLNFQNFAEWYNDNYYEIDSEIMHLDKDILHKGNKIYSPNNCVFVPQCINSLFIKNDAKRGKYPIGVSQGYKNTYIAKCNINKNNQMKTIGRYSNPEDAFYLGYKPFKEQYIKKIADKYKDKIPVKLYNAMISWKVEITD